MNCYTVKDLRFSYAASGETALDGVSFSVEKGSFAVLCGASGCGKTTLLRYLKSVLQPHGEISGEIYFMDTPLESVPQREQASRIGFVMQSPENQVVTDKVWHELAFGLESLGLESAVIRRRVAETAAFFGIEDWLYKNVSELSGGEKQLLCLASVMAMQPDVLLLDEPCAQLDPIAAEKLLSELGRINRELGTTVILSEHRLEEAFAYADRVLYMEKGRVIFSGTPREAGAFLKDSGRPMFCAMPAAMRIWSRLDSEFECPVSVRDGKAFLEKYAEIKPPKETETPEAVPQKTKEDAVLSARNLWFHYDTDESKDILRGLDITLYRGGFYALMGGNGAGKTTALRILAGLSKPCRGALECSAKIGVLPQYPQTLFVKKTVGEDLLEMLDGSPLDKNEKQMRLHDAAVLCEIDSLLERHPFDLSGGEAQKAALAKILLGEPDILLLDEPTKGLDADFKRRFAGILKKLCRRGVSVLCVSHDTEFCAEYADRCGLMFDGSITAEGSPADFFSGNTFYTTSANRMAKEILPRAVTVSHVLFSFGAPTEKADESDELTETAELPCEEAAETTDTAVTDTKNKKTAASVKSPKPLKTWRKILAGILFAISAAILIYAASITDFTKLVSPEGITAPAKEQLIIYASLILSLFGAAAFLAKKSPPPPCQPSEKKKRRLAKRTVVAAVIVVLAIPLTLLLGIAYLGANSYGLISVLVLIESMVPFFLIFEGRKPKARELAVVAVLCAMTVAGRAVFFMLPQFKPVMAMTIIAGVALGGETGFIVGSTSMLVSNLMFSQGPWTPWQMFCMGAVGFLAGVLFRKGALRPTKLSLAVFGALCAVVIYGGIMNPASVLLWSPESFNMKTVIASYVTGFPMDLVHGLATAFFLVILSEPMLEKLDRIKTKYGLEE